MEHPDVALVRRGYQAFNAGDAATLSEVIAEDAVQHSPGTHMFSGDFRGRDAILASYGKLAEETGGTFRAELVHCLTDGQGHVVAVHHVTGSRKGRTFDQMGAIVFTVRGGQAVDLLQADEDIDVSNEFFS